MAEQTKHKLAKRKDMDIWAEQLANYKTIVDKIRAVQADFDFMSEPDETFLDYIDKAADPELVKQYSTAYLRFKNRRTSEILRAAADELRVALVELPNNPEEWTDEQRRVIRAATERQRQEHDEYEKNCCFTQALEMAKEQKSIFPEEAEKTIESVNTFFAAYYLATHPQYRPSAITPFKEKDKAEFVALYRRLENAIASFFGGVDKAIQIPHEKLRLATDAFIAKENPTAPKAPAGTKEKFIPILPPNMVMPNNKLSTFAFSRDLIASSEYQISRFGHDLEGHGLNLGVGKDKAKNDIKVKCFLTYMLDEMDGVKISSKKPLSEYDHDVYIAVVSLYVAGNRVITPSMVFRTMNSLQNSAYVSPSQQKAVIESIDKMRFVRAEIDLSAELAERKKTVSSRQITKEGKTDTALIMARKTTLTISGHSTTCYEIYEIPILYEYASTINQVLTVPIEKLAIKAVDEATGKLTESTIPVTDMRRVITRTLIVRIEGMKAKNGLNNNTISLVDYTRGKEEHKGLYSIAGFPNPTRTEAARIRSAVEDDLKYWRATGEIDDYRVNRKNQQITGYEIILKP